MSINWKLEPGYTTAYLDDGEPIWDVMLYNGRTYPTFEDSFIQRMNEMHEKLQIRPTDIIILSYMKSGTHWLWEIINMLLQRTAGIDEQRCKAEGFLEMASLNQLEILSNPRVLSSHLHPDELPKSILDSNVKIVVPFRNPKDTAVSMYHHLSAEKLGTNLRCGWHRFITDVWFSPKDMVYATWTEYSAALWRLSKEKSNVHAIIYEQMIKNPYEVIKQLASFLDIAITDELATEIAEASRFDNMKQLKAESEKVYETTFPSGYSMFRKGKVGDWKNHFSVQENEFFNEAMNSSLESYEEIADLMRCFTFEISS